jgi:hypothetical protein
METARLIIEVVAGVIPEKPEPEFTRQYAITSAEWQQARESAQTGAEEELLAVVAGKAQGYAGLLMLQPNRLNWVKTTWLWL